jgi:hypothetical protein
VGLLWLSVELELVASVTESIELVSELTSRTKSEFIEEQPKSGEMLRGDVGLLLSASSEPLVEGEYPRTMIEVLGLAVEISESISVQRYCVLRLLGHGRTTYHTS